ncbi:mannonate dehydratase [Aestuariibacter sp. GS-14]|uniref:mannonate dehydratase n=1 Tax=Aestuariibacter sp. GS-14 TaxID=2590670 RepID=UPI00112D5194|nr:mannonate dehydratase [Aestuariibacter sp. GS-14]TPV59985.1 mannonate dehydratase [Aestuariibacter sp. GS-14]
MIETWRWFGPGDSISLEKIAQAGAKGIVSSLHEVKTGDAWHLDDILERKKLIEKAGLTWSVIESIPVHNDIKTRSGDFKKYIENYKTSVANAGKAGVDTVCYNFMPVVDWTRTNLNYKLPNTSFALRFEMSDFVAYDVFVLERPGAEADYTPEQLEKARVRINGMTEAEILLLEKNVIAGLPGGEGSYSRESIKVAIQEFINLGTERFRNHLFEFLREVIPVAEEHGVKLCIHPDDPPFSLFGLPRVVSTKDDARKIIEAVPSSSNGLTMCAGSFGARADNNLVDIVNSFSDRVYFVHLRNVIRESDGSFYEAEHLNGDTNMVSLIDALLKVEKKHALQIPMRPDHGHLMADEIGAADVKPGYSYTGRLKGLSELRGVIHTLNALDSSR